MKMRIMRQCGAAGIGMLLCWMPLGATAGIIHYVSPSGSHTPPFTSWATAATNIQAAIDVATDPGATVLVTNGVYATGGRVVAGSSLTNRVVIDKPIIVASVNGPEVTIIRGAFDPVSTIGDAAIRCVWMTNGATLIGFTLTNGATRAAGGQDRNGGGLWAQSSAAEVLDCIITGNRAHSDGGGAFGGNHGNCLYVGNRARFGGGASFFGSPGMIVNGTLTENVAYEYGGGVSFGTLHNSIVYFNIAPILVNAHETIFSHSCMWPLPAGSGNITNQPLFVNAAMGDYRLSADSPCINRGNDTFVAGVTDLAGNPRIVGDRVDMGAYEFQLTDAGTSRFVRISNPSARWPYATWSTAATNIQDAVDAALPGNTVVVSNGVYNTGGRPAPGLLLTNRVVIDKPITVRSVNGPLVTTIQGFSVPAVHFGPNAVRCVWITNGASLVGFTLTGGATRDTGGNYTERSGGGVWAYPDALIHRCVISGNRALRDGGGAYGGRHKDNLLSNNSAQFGGGAGFFLTSGAIIHCTVVNNEASGLGGGVDACDNIVNSILYFNTAPVGLNYNESTLSYSCTTPLPAGAGNITNNPVFVNVPMGNYRLLSASPCINTGNNNAPRSSFDLDGKGRIDGGTVDMGAYEFSFGVFRYVDINNPTPAAPYNTWATAATNIQDAIDAAAAGNLIFVSNGVYQTGGRFAPVGSGLTNRVVIDKPLAVQSVNGPEVTIIRGAWDPVTTNGPAAVRGVWMTGGSFLVGFTVENGATRNSGGSEIRSGGGISAVAPNAAIIGCIIRNNHAYENGGGGWGGTYVSTDFRANTADFGGGASFVNRPGSLNACRVFDNMAQVGGGIYRGSHTNTLIVGNRALSLGGGTAFADLFNCTVVGNLAGPDNGGVWNGTIVNSIIYFNQATSQPNYGGSELSIHYSCTWPFPAGGAGNFTNDPLFVSLVTTNLMLTAGSPCRDMGDNTRIAAGQDLAGQPRIVNTFVDVGAYEFQGSPSNDYDGDGMTTTEERIAGTNPLDPNDVWAVSQIHYSGSSQISFPTVLGRVYTLERTDDLAASPQVWIPVTGNIVGLDIPRTIVDPVPGTNRAYRVRVELVP